MRSSHRPVILFLLAVNYICFVSAIGVNWGRSSSHPLPAAKVVTGLLRANSISRVKLLDAEPEVMESLSSSGIGVTVGIPNQMLRNLSFSKKAAATWVHDNVTRYFPAVRIEHIAVGDEPFLLGYGQQFQPFVIGAAKNIQLGLAAAKLTDKVKVIVPCSSDIFKFNTTGNSSGTVLLPSKGYFRPDLNKTMTELLYFLSKQGSPFVIDVDPFSISQQNKNISMDFLLFGPKSRQMTTVHNKYKNFFDASIDTLVTSLSKAGFGDMEIIVGRIGWPTDGAINATSAVADTFMHGLVDHLQRKAGTPLRPKKPPLETYIFSLLDEDQRPITTGEFERHRGIFTFDGQAKYNVDLGQGSKELVNARDVDYLSPKWCVVNNNNMDLLNVSATFKDACSNADCTALSPGGSCFEVGWPGNVSYAYNSYYQQHDQRGDSCIFGGLGLITTVDPSIGECRFAIAVRTSSSPSAVVAAIWWTIILSACTLLGFI